MEIYGIDDSGKVSKYKRMSVSREKEIEDFIECNPGLLEKDLMIISRQQQTSTGKIIDLMGLDKDGNVVIIEIKKDQAPRKVISQVLDYGVWAESLTYQTLNSIAKQQQKLPKHNNLLEMFRDWADELDPEFNQNQKLYVIGEEIDEETRALASYLQRKGVDLFCLELNFHENKGEKKCTIQRVVDEVKNNDYPKDQKRSFTEQDWVERADKNIQELYTNLRENVLQLGDDIKINPVQSYIGFSRSRNFFAIKVRQDALRITLHAPPNGLDDPGDMTVPHSYRDDLRVIHKFRNKEKIPDVINLIRQSYDIS